VTDVTRRRVTVGLERDVAPVAEPPVKVTLCAAVLKGDQMDAVVRDATMLGVAAIVPTISAHVAVAKAALRSAAAISRWQRVALASAKQSGRAVLPAVHPVATFDAVLSTESQGPIVICVEPALGLDASDSDLPRPTAVRLLVGPEGGWSPDELASARRHGATPLALGPRTLRAETAPIVALAMLWTRWGWT
jgi:16S rRNA (uracil1498-N3)-methyltransferase